jgi:hypothetical protein
VLPSRNKHLATILAFALGACGTEPEVPDAGAIDILFVGNSLTFYWNMPGTFQRLALESGLNVDVEVATVGGASLADHAYQLDTPAKITERDWDYVVLQGSSYHIAFPDNHALILDPIVALKQMIEENSTDTEVVFFLDWSMKSGVSWDGQQYSYADFQQRIRDGTIALSDDLDFQIAPVGWAWYQVIRERPEVELFDVDEAHPSRKGAYLQACVYYATILQRELNVGYYGTLDEEEARYFQQVGSSMVMDSLEVWNLERNPS